MNTAVNSICLFSIVLGSFEVAVSSRNNDRSRAAEFHILLLETALLLLLDLFIDAHIVRILRKETPRVRTLLRSIIAIIFGAHFVVNLPTLK